MCGCCESEVLISLVNSPLLLAKPYLLSKAKPDIAGYWYSEKLDGIRVLWDGKQNLLSRLGNPLDAPPWFLSYLPRNITLDGELYLGRNRFSETVSVVKKRNSGRWDEITFCVFDIPKYGDIPFEDRILKLKELFPHAKNTPVLPQSTDSRVSLVEHNICKGKEHLEYLLESYTADGAEGLMLREPRSLYVGKRSSTLLKVKNFFDAEAIVIDYEPGKGKYSNMVGSFICKMESGNQFSVGSGLTDLDRKDPPPIGAIINYRFQELTPDGIPRFPSYIGPAIDKTRPKDVPKSQLNPKTKN